MTIRLELFGGLRATAADREIDWLPAQRLRAALFVYLAVERTTTRAALTSLFWPESDEENARHALRQNLYQLKRVLGDAWIDARTHELRVTDAVQTDVAAFETALARSDAKAAALLYAGPFLDGVHLLDVKEWETWVDARRARCARDFRRACRDWVAACEARGDAAEAISAAQHWVRPDPLDDEAQHRLIELLGASGQRADALAHYAAYARMLEADGLQPLDETRTLIARIEAMRPELGPATAVAPQVQVIEVPQDAVRESALPTTGRRVQPLRPLRRRRAGAAALLAAAVVVTLVVASRAPGPQPDVYLTGTLAAEGTDVAARDLFVRQFESTLRRVPGVRAADPTRVSELRTREGGDPDELGPWIRRARLAGAGRLLLLQVTQNGRFLSVAGDLYDARRGDHLRGHEIHFAIGTPAESALEAASLTESILDLMPGSLTSTGTLDEEAARAFVSAMQAERRWDLQEAVSHYRIALARDASHPRANFRLAQALVWLDEPETTWSHYAVRAEVAADRLDPDEAALAGALVALAEGRFADACAIYRDLLDADAFSFPAWYGLGTCHWRDNLVIPDPASPSGWSFRSSHNAAVAAFGKAFELQPAFVFTFGRDAVTRLEELFHAERHIRAGWDASRQQRFGAFASLAPAGAAAGDTLAFVPYVWEQIVAGDFPPGNAEALERGRETVLATSASLARDFADNPAALLIRAETLEAMQALDGVGAHGSALEWAQRATDAARTPRERAYAALVESRLLLKLGRHADARRIALRVVRDAQTDSMEWEDIAGLAALTGQAHELARLYGQNARELLEQSEFDGVPLSVLEPRQRLIAYAMIGAPPDSVYRLGRELEEKANAWLTPVQLAERRCELIGRPLDVAYPVLLRPIEDEACRPFGRRSMQWADHNEDTRTVLAIMDELDVLRAGDPPNRLALDAVFNEAWLVARAGDTLRARRNLDASLDALAAIPALRLRQPVAIAGLIRAMALSAELAAAAGDRQRARRWASAVAELWQESDIPELQSLVRSMKALARGP